MPTPPGHQHCAVRTNPGPVPASIRPTQRRDAGSWDSGPRFHGTPARMVTVTVGKQLRGRLPFPDSSQWVNEEQLPALPSEPPARSVPRGPHCRGDQ